MEEFVFISINKTTGALYSPKSYLTYGLAGLALAELYRQGKITWDGKSVIAAGKSSTGDHLLDELMRMIENRKAPYRLQLLIGGTHYKVPRFCARILERLEDNGHIRIEQRRFLGLIPYSRYIVSRVSEHEGLIKELKSIVLSGERKPEACQALLLSNLQACGVLRRLFNKEERRKANELLKKIAKGNYFETLNPFEEEVLKAVRRAIAAARSSS
jgi:hypothetical protein